LWGVPVLAIEPWLWRRGGPSLLRDLSEGRPGRVVRLLIAGLVCGLFWESANFLAGGRWIYTVPGLDGLKWFEMPPLGFLGFAPFALCCWSMARGLVELGLLADWEREREPATVPTGASAKDAIATVNAPPTPDAPPTSDESPVPLESPATEDASPADASSPADAPSPAANPAAPAEPRRLTPKAKLLAIALTTLGSVLVLQGMDRWTVDSLRPRAEDVPGIPDGIAEFVRHRGRDDVVGLLHAIESGDLYVPGQSNERMLRDLERHARIVLLRGIGAKNAARLARVGIDSIDELAAADRDELVAALDAIGERGWEPRPRRVAVWISGARRAANGR
jgi:predicted flap endonuclease-1-like 5' DNA nuclease